MADKRKLLLEVDVDVDSKDLDGLAKDADDAKDGFEDLNKGLKKLDQQFEDTTKRSADLRAEISKSGDLALIKDLQQAERELKKLTRDRETLVGGLTKNDPTDKLRLPNLAHAGGDAAEDFTVGFAQRLGPLFAKAPMGPAGAAIGGALAVAALPLLGGALAAGIVGAGGGLGLAGGIALAAKSAAVKSAASDLSEFIGNELERAAEPMVPAVVNSLATIKQQFIPLKDDFREIFSASAGLLQPLTDGALSGITRIVQGIKDVVTSTDGAGPVFRELGTLAGTVGDAIGDVFTQLSDNGDEAAAVIRGLGIGLAGTIRFIGDFIDVTSSTIRPLLDMGIAVGNVGEALYGWIPIFGDQFTQGRDNLIDMKSALDSTAGAAVDGAEAARINAAATAELDAQIRNVNIDLATQIGYYNQIRGQNLSAAEAQLAYKDAIDQAKGSLEKKNVVTSGEEKALLRAVSAADQNIAALEKTGATSDVTSAKFNTQRNSLIKLAERMGMNSVEARKYIDRILQIPTNVNTKIAMTGIPTALGDLNILKNKIDALPTYKKFRYIVEQNQVTIRTDAGGKKALASGGPMRAGETYLVGEEGPELVTPKQNGYVHDAKATAAMASSSGPSSSRAGGAVTYHLTVINHGPVASSGQFEDMVGGAFNNLVRKGKVDGVRT